MTTPARTSLDRRRKKAADAQATAEKARAGVTELDQRLETNADLTRRQKVALRTAVAEATRLKRVLKNAAEDRKRLTKRRRKAVTRVTKATAKAETAESKYDKSVLADLVAREKERDRAGAAPAAIPIESAPSAAPVTAATQTAVGTAARKTATRAAATRAPRTRRTATS